MNTQPDSRLRATPHPASQSSDRVLAVTLIVALAIPGAVFAATYPTLAVAFAAGVLAVRAGDTVADVIAAGREWSVDVQNRFHATSE